LKNAAKGGIKQITNPALLQKLCSIEDSAGTEKQYRTDFVNGQWLLFV